MERNDSTPALCDHFIDLEDPWVGTYCKLPQGHDGDHSAHYPHERPAQMQGLMRVAAAFPNDPPGWTPDTGVDRATYRAALPGEQ